MTLIEIIVAMAITAIVLAAVYSIFFSSFRMNEEQNRYVEAQDALRIASLRIEQDIRSSSQNITIVQEGNSVQIVDNSETDKFPNIEYYVDSDHILYRNNIRISDRIVSLEISNPYDDALEAINESIVDVLLKSDFNGEVIVHEQRVYLRSPQR